MCRPGGRGSALISMSVNGRASMKRGLGAVFAMYSEYDQLVSVSHQLTRLNRAELAQYAPADRFRTVRNFPDVEHVTRGARRPLSDFFAESDAQFEAADQEIPPRPDWYEALQADGGELRWFVTVGRLSPEKNHARLIRSFEKVHAAHPESRLLIVGAGPLRADLQQQIDDGDEDDIDVVEGALQICGEGQPSQVAAGEDAIGKSRLENRNLARIQPVDTSAVDVHARHVMAPGGKAGTADKSDISRTQYSNSHRELPLRLTASRPCHVSLKRVSLVCAPPWPAPATAKRVSVNETMLWPWATPSTPASPRR